MAVSWAPYSLYSSNIRLTCLFQGISRVGFSTQTHSKTHIQALLSTVCSQTHITVQVSHSLPAATRRGLPLLRLWRSSSTNFLAGSTDSDTPTTNTAVRLSSFPSSSPTLPHPLTARSSSSSEILWECTPPLRHVGGRWIKSFSECAPPSHLTKYPKIQDTQTLMHAHLTTQRWVNVDAAVEVYKTQIAQFPFLIHPLNFFRGHQRMVRSNKSLQIFPFYLIILSWC